MGFASVSLASVSPSEEARHMNNAQAPQQGPRIIQITAVAVPGERRTFVNVYGLDEHSRVWQWNAKDAKWIPNKVTAPKPKPATNGYDDAEGFR